ncbi:MAG: hypothetical protein IKD04_09730 [Clostridia bacterium]|nr:hypothetical protein [Clostridia bacterium]
MGKWLSFFIISLAVFAASVLFAIFRFRAKYKSGRILTPIRILFGGVIVSSFLLFIPIYGEAFAAYNCSPFETFLISIHNMIRLFVVDGDFTFVTQNLAESIGWLEYGYSILFSVLFVVAPLLTFGFVLSFFKNVLAYIRFAVNYRSDIYIFSELSEKSLSLAKSILSANGRTNENGEPIKNRFAVFTDVFEKEEERSFELIEKARELGAICFKKDIVTVNFTVHSKGGWLHFFTIGEDHSENINQGLKLVTRYKNRDNTKLYVFSTQAEAEPLLSRAFADGGDEIKIKVRRVNEVQSLISRTLYDSGFENIFESAVENPETGAKDISALVVGMGKHGAEMTKTLAWFCQMDGYRVRISAFDADPDAELKFRSLCPELMDERFNSNSTVDGEAKYEISIFSGVDVTTKTFDDMICAMPQVTYVLVALGNDELNISVAMKLRMLFERSGINPKIQAIVYDTDKSNALKGITNFKSKSYDIEFIGDRDTAYSESVIIDGEVEMAALSRHRDDYGGTEAQFWQYDYNYKSSVASVIHKKMKKKCKMAGIEKPVSQRTDEEKWALRKLEHCRWNAYMRSEGYCYAPKRNDLAKNHHLLIPFDALPLSEQEKDDY